MRYITLHFTYLLRLLIISVEKYVKTIVDGVLIVCDCSLQHCLSTLFDTLQPQDQQQTPYTLALFRLLLNAVILLAHTATYETVK